MDSSLATLRRHDKTWFFYHSENWGKSNEKYCGTPSNPFQTKVWHKSRNQMYDLNGRYANIHHAGLWLINIYRLRAETCWAWCISSCTIRAKRQSGRGLRDGRRAFERRWRSVDVLRRDRATAELQGQHQQHAPIGGR